eukprot:TRINITY_DN1259_c0_g1_i1.p1 TRINITY_DN1259_c0_g1~~TRINITY_DN1259_c0_g1_i1.p1  ORF type:complete len:556 (+),score=149.23 TRINITY_DN1259_c0_g1_i1:117-1670(+)
MAGTDVIADCRPQQPPPAGYRTDAFGYPQRSESADGAPPPSIPHKELWSADYNSDESPIKPKPKPDAMKVHMQRHLGAEFEMAAHRQLHGEMPPYHGYDQGAGGPYPGPSVAQQYQGPRGLGGVPRGYPQDMPGLHAEHPLRDTASVASSLLGPLSGRPSVFSEVGWQGAARDERQTDASRSAEELVRTMASAAQALERRSQMFGGPTAGPCTLRELELAELEKARYGATCFDSGKCHSQTQTDEDRPRSVLNLFESCLAQRQQEETEQHYQRESEQMQQYLLSATGQQQFWQQYGQHPQGHWGPNGGLPLHGLSSNRPIKQKQRGPHVRGRGDAAPQGGNQQEARGREAQGAPYAPKPRAICRHFLTGTCYYGTDCRFSHECEQEAEVQKRAREMQLRQRTHDMQGKGIGQRMTGICVSWDSTKCFGFVESDSGERGFVHAAFLAHDPAMIGIPPGHWQCVPGRRYTFTLVPNDRDPSKWSAIDVQSGPPEAGDARRECRMASPSREWYAGGLFAP